MKKLFGYVRVSDPKQLDGVSLDAQKAEIERFAATKQFEIVRWFVEQRTAAKQGRPIFDAMIRAVRAGQSDGLVVHKYDRSARNYQDWGVLGDLVDAGFEVHSAFEEIDLNTRGGRLVADVQMVVSVDFIRNQRNEALKGIKGRLNQGIWPFQAPIGYLDNGGGKLKTPDPKRADLCVETFERYATGNYSYRSLAAKMRKRHFTTPSGKPVTLRIIENMLSNPFYHGVMRVKTTGETFPGKHEPLISVALFNRVQDLIAGKSGKKVTRHNHLYRGLFTCAHCQLSMIPEKQKGRVYYRCKRTACPTKTVREDAIEQAVAKKFLEIGFTKEKVHQCYAIVNQWIATEKANAPLKTYKLQLAKIDSRIDKLNEAKLDGDIPQDEFLRLKAKLVTERATIDEQRRRLPDLKAKAENLSTLAELILSHILTYQYAEPHERRQIVEMDLSNRQVDGKNIYLEPSSLVVEVNDTLDLILCDHHRDSGRTGDILEGCDLPDCRTLPTADYKYPGHFSNPN